MNHRLAFTALTAATLLLGAAPQLASAAAAADTATDTPLRRACPQIDTALHDAMQSTAYRLSGEKLIKVQFTLRDDQISAVQPLGGSDANQRRIRDAVQRMNCRIEGEQQFAFELRMSQR